MMGLVNWEGLDTEASSVHSVLMSDNYINLFCASLWRHQKPGIEHCLWTVCYSTHVL